MPGISCIPPIIVNIMHFGWDAYYHSFKLDLFVKPSLSSYNYRYHHEKNSQQHVLHLNIKIPGRPLLKAGWLKWKYLRGSSGGIWLLRGQGYGLLLGHRLLKKAVLRKQECDKRCFVPCAMPFIVWYGILRLGQVSLVRFKVTENIKCLCDME